MKIIALLGSLLLCCIFLVFQPSLTAAEQTRSLSISLEEYEYPYKVDFLPITIEGQDLRMAYMDVPPVGKGNGRAVMLLHGKNFFGAYWKETIQVLSQHGYRVIIPDQIGFGKSSKPNIHYSFHLYAKTTKKLLDFLGVKQIAVVGHSMGGMLATRFSLMYPEAVTHLILEDSIGLEDYRTFVPYATVEDLYRQEMEATPESILRFHKGYYVHWQPQYGEYAEVAARWRLSGEYPRLAMASALTYEMIYEQPVCYEFANLSVKTLVIVGEKDRTVVGKGRVPKEVLSKVGQYPELGRRTAARIPGSTLLEIPDVGHIPHFEAAERFHEELLSFLER